MSTVATSTVAVLVPLVEVCKDGQEGYREAAEKVKSPDYQSLFSELAIQRQLYIGELRRLVLALGESVEDSGSVAGAVHRGWMDLKAALTSGDEYALLGECERGEEFAVARYQVAIAHDEIPGNIRAVIEQQFEGVQGALDRIRQLLERAKMGEFRNEPRIQTEQTR